MHGDDGLYGSEFVSVGLEADAGVVAQTEQVVDQLEPVGAPGHVQGCDVRQTLELRVVVVLQKHRH